MLRRTWIQAWVMGTVRTVCGASWARLMLAEVQAVQSGPGTLYLTLSDYPALSAPGGSVVVTLSSVVPPLIVTRASASGFYALDSVCTHAGCTVGAFVVANGFMQCPCHGSRYDIQGKVIRGPAEENLTSFETAFHGAGELTVALPYLPMDVKPIQIFERRSDSMRLKLTIKVTAGKRYELRFQTDIQGDSEAVLFAVTPYGSADQIDFLVMSDGYRHVYVDTQVKRGFYGITEMESL